MGLRRTTHFSAAMLLKLRQDTFIILECPLRLGPERSGRERRAKKGNVKDMSYKSDIEIAQEHSAKRITEIAAAAGIDEKYLEMYGNYKAKIDYKLLNETDKPDGKLILVTAITPTPAGEGKTTTSVGLADALNKVGKKTVSNKGTAQLSLEAYIAARAGMMSLTNAKGRAMNIVPDLLVVPPALEVKARDILVADFINGSRNTMQGTAKPVVVPQLAGYDSSWFLLCTNRPVKPLIYQQRKKAKFVSKTQETDENVFMKKQFLYGADSRGNAGFGFWQMAFGSDGTGASD